MPRKQIDRVVDYAKDFGAKGLAYLSNHEDGTYKASFSKFMTEEQLKAIVQNAYEAMKAGETELEAITMPVVQEAETVAASPSVNIFTGGKSAPKATAVATDNVPDGALDVNEDGTVNVYDSDGKKTGTMTQEQAEEVQKKVTTIVIEESGK